MTWYGKLIKTPKLDGWRCNVVCVDREKDGVMIRTWTTEGQELQPSNDHRLLTRSPFTRIPSLSIGRLRPTSRT